MRTVLDREAANATARHDDAAWTGDAERIEAARSHALDLARAGARARGLTPAAADAEAETQRADLEAREHRIALSRMSNAELLAIVAGSGNGDGGTTVTGATGDNGSTGTATHNPSAAGGEDEPKAGGDGDRKSAGGKNEKSSAPASSATQKAAAQAKSILAERDADPARTGERDIERDIADAKERGEIQTEAEEHRRRFDLRRDAQSARGIPPERQRLLTKAELAEYRAKLAGLESPEQARAWLDDRAALAGPHAPALRAELEAQLFPPSPPTTAPPAETPTAILAQYRDLTPAAPPQSEAERRARLKEADDALVDLHTRPAGRRGADERRERYLDIAARFGVVPERMAEALGTRLFGLADPARRIDAARTIVALSRLIPDEAARAFGQHRQFWFRDAIVYAEAILRHAEGGAVEPGLAIQNAYRDLGDTDAAYAFGEGFKNLAPGGMAGGLIGTLARTSGAAARQAGGQRRTQIQTNLSAEEWASRKIALLKSQDPRVMRADNPRNEAISAGGSSLYLRHGDLVDRQVVTTGVPNGFKDTADFKAATDRFLAALPPGSQIGVRGSAVHGRAFREYELSTGQRVGLHDGPRFDAGRTSDIDLFVVNKELFAKLKAAGLVRGGAGDQAAGWSVPLDMRLLRDIGERRLADALGQFQRQFDRQDTRLMIFGDLHSVQRRGTYLLKE